jgi:uncharacterized protein (DUF697 family)
MNIPEATSETNQENLLAICLFAAFADGEKSDAEREEVRRLADDVGLADLSSISRKILMRKLPLETVVAGLTQAKDRLLAYELALGVCEAGGVVTAEEKQFLTDLRRLLNLGDDDASEAEAAVAALVLADVDTPEQLSAVAAGPDNSGMILKYAILNGALELLPESLATVAIIPMQMKMVYRIGKNHGVELDRSNIKDFLATAGIGLGSQMVEGFARKLLGGFAKKIGGKLAGRAASQITGSAMSFASTYAIGHIAEKYYSGGRKLEASSLKAMLAPLQSQAKELHTTYLPQIQERAKSLNTAEIFSLVRGKTPV